MTSALEMIAKDAFKHRFDGILELRTEGQASLYVDGRTDAPSISAKNPGKVDCIWRAPQDMMKRNLSSQRALERAVISGRLVIAGDMSLMSRMRIF